MKISLPDALAKITHWVIINLQFSESNRLIVSVICAWLSIKAISITTKYSKHEQHEAEQLNRKLHKEWSRKRAGDFDLTGKCDWKRDRKCSTRRMRTRFAAVLLLGNCGYLTDRKIYTPYSQMADTREKTGS